MPVNTLHQCGHGRSERELDIQSALNDPDEIIRTHVLLSTPLVIVCHSAGAFFQRRPGTCVGGGSAFDPLSGITFHSYLVIVVFLAETFLIITLVVFL